MRGHVLLDRERSRPQAWTDAPERGRPAGIPAARRVATPSPRAPQRRARALTAGGPATGGTGARVDGHDRRLRLGLAAQPRADGLAVAGPAEGWRGWRPRQGTTLRTALPEADGTRLRAGDGPPGPRWYAWPWRPRAEPLAPDWRRWRLVRRRVRDPAHLSASSVVAPQRTPLDEGVRVAGTRWPIASGVEAATGEGGWDHEAVRSGTGWDRPRTRALWADALRTVLRADARAVDAFHNSPPPSQTGSRLAACQAGRGRGSHGASRRAAEGSGAWSWRGRRPPPTSWPGPPGVAGIRPSPSTLTTGVAGGSWRHGLPDHVLATVVLGSLFQRPMSGGGTERIR